MRRHDRLLLVDAISSLSSISVPVDEWDLDVVVSGSQKGWMVPPGLGLLSVNERAWEAQERCTTPRFYFDLKRAKESLENGQTPGTPAVSIFFQLDRALDMMLAEGLENIFARHHALARIVRDGVRSLGLDLFAAESMAFDIEVEIVDKNGDALQTDETYLFLRQACGFQRPLKGECGAEDVRGERDDVVSNVRALSPDGGDTDACNE